MADQTPGEANLARDGAQLNVREARAVADDRGTVRGSAPTNSLDRDVLEPPVPESGATSNEPAARGTDGRAGHGPATDRAPDQRPFTDSETALGGADAVQKTTWGVGHGTEPDGRQEYAPVGLKKGDGDVVARVATGGGVSPVAWVIGLLAVVALLVYGFGLLRR